MFMVLSFKYTLTQEHAEGRNNVLGKFRFEFEASTSPNDFVTFQINPPGDPAAHP